MLLLVKTRFSIFYILEERAKGEEGQSNSLQRTANAVNQKSDDAKHVALVLAFAALVAVLVILVSSFVPLLYYKEMVKSYFM